jgi:predicted nucleotidyltransferase
MVSSDLRTIISQIAQDFHVKTVWMFGSSLDDPAKAADIDLAVEGLPTDQFFEFYGRLFLELPKPVDLVDLSQDPPIAAIVREKGVRIYELGA